MVLGTLRIDARFRGPPESGNGGYVCGRVARFIEGPAVVRLHIPPPLDRELEVRREGNDVTLHGVGGDGESRIASARPTTLDVDPPSPPAFGAAVRAAEGYRGFHRHPFPTCFVCGPHREPGDGLRIFAGPIDEGQGEGEVKEGAGVEQPDGPPHRVAAPWIPHDSLDDGTGRVIPEFLWAALDCPGAYTFTVPDDRAMVLGELALEIRGEVAVGEHCVVLAWERGHEGRRHWTTTALYGETGDCRAVGEGVWFEI